MLAVWSWLRELVELDNDIGAEAAAAALTAAGLEVEAATAVGDDFSGVVVAEVVAKRKHPHADKLTLVDIVDDSGVSTEVVCGAANVPDAGGRVLWARPGARLPGGVELSGREIKGVLSAGMLCSEAELGLGDDQDGIIVLEAGEMGAALGSEAAISLGLRDVVFDVGVPANRPDALGHLGIARELAALVGGRVVRPEVRIDDVTDAGLDATKLAAVEIAEPTLCPRYTARIVDGLTVGQSPRWMRRRLELVGVRPISNMVDVTNYVMFELGQPLHAFDYRQIRGQRIIVRRARDGETMKTLDAAVRTLGADDLLICDGERPVALAGVMGGADSEVANDTSRVLLEAAHFQPKTVRRTSRRLDLRSESSHRFERYVDPNGADFASARAATLLAELAGGRVAAGLVDVYPSPARATTVTMRASRASALTGIEISTEQASSHLMALGLGVEARDSDTLVVSVPTARADLSREVDLIEEVLRLEGFENVPATLPPLSSPPKRRLDPRPFRARDALLGAGLNEAITFGFTSPESIAALRFSESDPRSRPITIRNPMSRDQSVLRTSLLSTLLAAVAHNLKHQEADVALFEIGSVFLGEVSGTTLPAEPTNICAVIAGRRPGFLGERPDLDLFDLKGILDRLIGALDPRRELSIEVSASAAPTHLHPGLSGELRLATGGVIGEFGEVHPSVRAAFEIEVPVFGFELGLAQLPSLKPAQLHSIAKFPAVTRDLSFFLKAEVPAESVARELRGAAGELLESAELIEDFRDPAYVPDGQKGMLWSLTYRSHERTLTDAEVDASHETLCQGVLATLSATRR